MPLSPLELKELTMWKEKILNHPQLEGMTGPGSENVDIVTTFNKTDIRIKLIMLFLS